MKVISETRGEGPALTDNIKIRMLKHELAVMPTVEATEETKFFNVPFFMTLSVL